MLTFIIYFLTPRFFWIVGVKTMQGVSTLQGNFIGDLRTQLSFFFHLILQKMQIQLNGVVYFRTIPSKETPLFERLPFQLKAPRSPTAAVRDKTGYARHPFFSPQQTGCVISVYQSNFTWFWSRRREGVLYRSATVLVKHCPSPFSSNEHTINPRCI